MMKKEDKKVLKAFIVLLLFISVNLSAQGNSDLDNWNNGNSENAGGNGNGNSPTAPIDNYIIVLLGLGLIYGIKTKYYECKR